MPKPALKSAVAPPACHTDWVRRGVVGDRRRASDPDQDAEAEEQPDYELLGASCTDVEADQDVEARDVRADAPAVGQIAPDVHTEREQARRDRHEPHRLAEERARLITGDSRLKRCVDGAQCSDLNAARISSEKSSGSSQAAKWPPRSTSLK